MKKNFFFFFKRYIYNGTVDINNLDPDEIFDLLEACDELDINDLIEDLQNYLITEEKEWVQQNLVHIEKISSEHKSFNILQDYCSELITSNPGLVLETNNNIATIEKSMFLTILKSDFLELDEIKIWDYVVQWGTGQNKEILEKNISEWNENDFEKMKNNLKDIIPLIRFDQITSTDFYKKIQPYKKALDKDIYDEILQYYLNVEWKPKLLLLRGPRIGNGKSKSLLSLEMKSLIVNWIDGNQVSYNENNLPYYFKSIHHGFQDGFSRAVFEEKCYNIEQAVIIMKLKETKELVGGYNPVCWNIKERSPDDNYCIETDKSFIFKIDENQIKNSILSRIRTPGCAIRHNPRVVSEIKVDGINFHEILMDFYDLDIRNSTNNELYCYYYYHYNAIYGDIYENNLNLTKKDKRVHLLEEYEVYQLVKKNQ